MATKDLKLKSKSQDLITPFSSARWLSIYGLKKLKLEYEQVLSSIGFKSKDSYINILKRPVSSRYNNGMFKKVEDRKNGTIYNLTATKENIKKIEKQLKHATELYKNRLQWLTSGSRRTFGVVEERNICIVIDIQGKDNDTFDACIDIILSVMKEQTDHCQKLNLIRCSKGMQKWNNEPVNVTTDSLCEAVDWLTDLVDVSYYDCTDVTESILDAASHEQLEAIYLFTNGVSCINGFDILKQKIQSLSIPINVTLVCNDNPKFKVADLMQISQLTGGRFHYYHGVDVGERNNYTISCDDNPTTSSLLRGVRPDVMLIWEELDKANNVLAKIHTMLTEIDVPQRTEENDSLEETLSQASQPISDSYLSSRQWLKRYGLKQQNLTLHSYLKSAVFNHCDGVLDIKQPSDDFFSRTRKTPTLVHAKYCHKFAHLKWSDGTTKHVHVTGSVYRKYQVAIMAAIEQIRNRLSWLQKGSRQLFGTIIEKKVIIVIDTSSSMATNLDLVKNKLSKLFQEQLHTKDEFNLIQFSTVAKSWKDFMVPCHKKNLDAAWEWVKDLEANGSTNTLAALEEAYKLEGFEAIYLLTDGRPDQPLDMVMSCVNEDIPIHTISFNCQDKEANSFLYDMAKKTNARYHYYYDIIPSDYDEPKPYESEDLHMLRKEIEKGLHDLELILKLRNECISKASIATLEANQKMMDKAELESHLISSRPTSTSSVHQFATGYCLNRASYLRLNKQPLSRPASAIVKPSKPMKLKNQNRPVSAFSVINIKNKEEKKGKKKQRKRKKSGSEIKQWLRENGINANKLTILDALAPTMIQQKATYVPSVKKDVFSKVYGEIFPILHSSGGKTKEYQIVNPQAVDLLAYEKKLKECICDIEEKLIGVVSAYDKENAERKFNVKSISDFKKEREKILQSLKDENQLSIIKDIKLVEREIREGNKYLKQSEELRNAVKELSYAKAKELKSENTTPCSTSQKMFTRPFSSQSRKNHHGRIRFHRVIARSDSDGYYYPAVVDKYVNPRYVNVNFDSGDNQLTSVRFVISVGGSTPCPILSVGDYVFLKSPVLSDSVYGNDGSVDYCYVPGIVQVTPMRMNSASKCYTVIRFNGTKLTALRKDMIRISRSRFVFSVRFIQQAQQTRKYEIQRMIVQQKSISDESDHDDNEEDNQSDDLSRHSSQLKEDNRSLSDSGKSDEDEKNESTERESRLLTDNDVPYTLPVNLLEEWKEKVRELEKEKESLNELRNNIQESNERYSAEQKEKVEKQYEEFVRGQKDLMLTHIEHQKETQLQITEQYKEMTERQMDMFKEQQKHQENLLKELLQQQRDALKFSDKQVTVKHVKDENTCTENNLFDAAEVHSPNATPVQTTSPEPPRERRTLEMPQPRIPHPPEEVRGYEQEFKVFVAPENDTVLMTHRESGVIISNEPIDTEDGVEVKNIPSALHVSQEVLARFKDDGWYYRGTVTKIFSNINAFLVEDAVGSLERVQRDDVITEEDDANNIIGVNDTVVALHPRYQYAYAPGIVNEVYQGGSMKVHFYDDEVSNLPRDELYMISPWKHERDCKYIRYKENSLIGQAVVSREDTTGSYFLAYVRGRVTGPRNYLIEWANQEAAVQNFAFLFGAHTKREPIVRNSFVLAICSKETFKYLPAQVDEKFENQLSVTFCNKERRVDVEIAQTFWISADYYKSAVQYWQEKQQQNI